MVFFFSEVIYSIFINSSIVFDTFFIIKVGPSPSKKICVNCFIESPLKMMKNALFHLKSSFRSQYICVFVTSFWSCRKNDLIRKARLISKFMTSQPGLQTIAIDIFPNALGNKGNQTIKGCQLMEQQYN